MTLAGHHDVAATRHSVAGDLARIFGNVVLGMDTRISIPAVDVDLSISGILISRADAIGDVVLTLPVAKVLKEHYPQATIGFLAKRYTQAVLEACPFVDKVMDADALLAGEKGLWDKEWGAIIHVFPQPKIARRAKQAGISVRVGTTNRLWHWWTCNRRVALGRKRSDLHEAQLNLKLLKALGIHEQPSLDTLRNMPLLEPKAPLPLWLLAALEQRGKNVVLHPSSRGSAREWPLENFTALADILLQAGFQVFITGVDADRAALQPLLNGIGSRAIELIGKLSLAELMSFIGCCDGLVAASTGPLHLAAVLGVATVGLYPAERPMHAGRWAPLGRYVTWLTAASGSGGNNNVLEGISPEDVMAALEQQLRIKTAANGH